MGTSEGKILAIDTESKNILNAIVKPQFFWFLGSKGPRSHH